MGFPSISKLVKNRFTFPRYVRFENINKDPTTTWPFAGVFTLVNFMVLEMDPESDITHCLYGVDL